MLEPRVVLVTRQTELDRLLENHATLGQAEVFLKQRGQSLEQLQAAKNLQVRTVYKAKQSIPDEWSIAEVHREGLDRFLFAQGDIVIAIGQDGLVANLAKYLNGQPVIGITPDAEQTEGVLTPITVDALPKLVLLAAAQEADIEHRTMVEARLSDGQRLAALNELFVGHRSHQSARYMVNFDNREEYQSSSGMIVSTGTGLTGWARSIMTTTHRQVAFAPDDSRAVYFAREPWPSKISGCELVFGEITRSIEISLTSRMNEGGVVFADGIEQDFMRFDWGNTVNTGLSEKTLNLVQKS